MATVALSDRLRGVITENLNLKLLSFAFALVLYSLVHGSQDAQRSVAVDLVVLLPSDSANRVLVSSLPPRVRLTLRGSRAALDDLHADDIGNLQLDVHSGIERHVALTPQMVHVPTGVTVEAVDPPSLDLAWEDEIVRDLPVQVSVVGSPAPGFVVKGVPVADPPTVRVRGPKSDVTRLEYVRAEAFDVTGRSEGTYAKDLKIDVPQGRITSETAIVKVTVEVTREIAERPFTKLAVAVVGPSKAKTQPAEVDVHMVCPPEILRSLRPEQVVPRVEVKSTATSGSESLPVIVSIDKCEAHATPSSVIVRW
jgi:hypothetical protein